MIKFVIGFIAGTLFGGALGFAICAIITAGSDEDDFYFREEDYDA